MKCMWGAAWVPGYSFGLSSGPAGFPAVFQKCLWRSTDTNTEKQSASPFVRPFFSFFFFIFFFFFPLHVLSKDYVKHSETNTTWRNCPRKTWWHSASQTLSAGLTWYCCLTWKGTCCCLATGVWLHIVAGGCAPSQRLTGLAWEIRQHHSKCWTTPLFMTTLDEC